MQGRTDFDLRIARYASFVDHPGIEPIKIAVK